MDDAERRILEAYLREQREFLEALIRARAEEYLIETSRQIQSIERRLNGGDRNAGSDYPSA